MMKKMAIVIALFFLACAIGMMTWAWWSDGKALRQLDELVYLLSKRVIDIWAQNGVVFVQIRHRLASQFVPFVEQGLDVGSNISARRAFSGKIARQIFAVAG
jgi:hypothetical protein